MIKSHLERRFETPESSLPRLDHVLHERPITTGHLESMKSSLSFLSSNPYPRPSEQIQNSFLKPTYPGNVDRSFQNKNVVDIKEFCGKEIHVNPVNPVNPLGFESSQTKEITKDFNSSPHYFLPRLHLPQSSSTSALPALKESLQHKKSRHSKVSFPHRAKNSSNLSLLHAQQKFVKNRPKRDGNLQKSEVCKRYVVSFSFFFFFFSTIYFNYSKKKKKFFNNL